MVRNYSELKKVSVIIPTYNRAGFLPQAIESILNQRYTNTEIIVVDDGSEDSTREVVKSLQDRHPNIFYFPNERSKGPSGARNTGLLKATGDFIAFLDSDDVWLEHHLAEGMEIFSKHPEIDVLFGNFSVYEYKNKRFLYNFFDRKKILHTLKSLQLTENVRLLNDNLFIALLKENFFHLGSTIVRRNVLENILFNEEITFSEDRDFAIRLYKQKGAVFACRLNPLFVMSRHEDNLYNTGTKNLNNEILKTHILLIKSYMEMYNIDSSEKKVMKRLLGKKHSELSCLVSQKRDVKRAFYYSYEGFKYSLTGYQFINLFKTFLNILLIRRGINYG